MNENENYYLGLLHLVYLLIVSDAEIKQEELNYLNKIKADESIPSHVFEEFQNSIIGKSEKEIYQNGIALINHCPDDLQLRAFVKLYQMANADGVLHVKEVRLLLYAIKTTHIDINTVIGVSNKETTA